jgi:ACR3 family arsenite transporter
VSATASQQATATPAPLSGFDRRLTLWVAVCMVAGVALARIAPSWVDALARAEFAQVNLPVGLLVSLVSAALLCRPSFMPSRAHAG